MDQLEQFLPVSPVGFKVLVEIVRQFAGDQLDNVILSRELILLSQVPAGARCLLDSLTSLPRELQQCMVYAYSDMTNYQQAVDHLHYQFDNSRNRPV